MTKKLVWLSSYPKSGNTWLRIIISNLLGEKELDINDLEAMPIASSRYVFEFYCGFNSTNITHDEADQMRPVVNDLFAKDCEEITFRKNHDAFQYLENGQPLHGNPEFYKTIYIIRNPLSIVASLANHNQVSLDRAIEQMNKEDYSLSKTTRKHPGQLRQKLFSWRSHVKSWNENNELEVQTIRYEDIFYQPLETLKKAFTFAGLDFTDKKILDAYDKSNFNEIKQKEKQSVFNEKPPNVASFFRKGQPNSWKEELTQAQAQKVIESNYELMENFGYITPEVLSFAGLKK
ncbi:MAG: sulfotransferase domain-containing protein [Bacteroidales bacterium]|nr:sulfotransferase domain-containing protein [Bacteroidales bacterium]MCF8327738.1 sulfotransferase domain-containing protein [Bacteroidales bacterium]